MKKVLLVLMLAGSLCSCGTTFFSFDDSAKHKTVLAKKTQDQNLPEPDETQAQIVFLRPSDKVGSAKYPYSVIYNVSSAQDEAIAVAEPNSKTYAFFEPGRHLLLSTDGVSSHILEAFLLAGERYYVVVRPMYQQGYQLRPVSHASYGEFTQTNPKFSSWLNKTSLVEPASGLVPWQKKYRRALERQKQRATEVWQAHTANTRAQLTLLEEYAEK
ncbi:hypothetical protein [Teredinibacter sp. KSP-S5-2]|uniref:hypothetical protein n=1 Tax=Teredinibacter sp. KSP-S5-2 TaxID=3034506 RepID=UPI002934F3A9|nr:hypothetical protein [Teredinibacter sp. KSP-S5-2]WNO09084.1 hypothetical protein P5V12_19255 [Teredinibacter sp. KSP-S5-2]